MKVGDLVKRAGINPLRINGLVLKRKNFEDGAAFETFYVQVLWPDKTCEWTDVTWLRRMDDARAW